MNPESSASAARLDRSRFPRKHVNIDGEAFYSGILTVTALLFTPALSLPLALRLTGVIPPPTDSPETLPPWLIDSWIGMGALAGLWFAAFACMARRRRSRHGRLLRVHPGEAWVRDHPWTGRRLRCDSGTAFGLALVLSVGLSLLTLTLVFIALRNPEGLGGFVLALVWIFAAGTGILALAFVSSVVQLLLRFLLDGKSVLDLSTIPVRSGGRLEGTLRLRSRHLHGDFPRGELRCVLGEVVERSLDGEGGVDIEFGYETLWSRPVQWRARRLGWFFSRLDLTEDLPEKLPPSRLRHSTTDNHVFWELEVTTRPSGKEPRYFFLLPVYSARG